MQKKALFLDLDNTIYPVESIGKELFQPLFELIGKELDQERMEEIKTQLMRRPFQKVAEEYNLSKTTISQGTELLRSLAYEGEIKPFEDYAELQKIDCRKFLVTTGFTKMQQAKVGKLNLKNDFDEIHIADPDKSELTKKDIFQDIMLRNNLKKEEILVVGDDAESEIQAAHDLGLDAVVYDHIRSDENKGLPNRITSFSELKRFL